MIWRRLRISPLANVSSAGAPGDWRASSDDPQFRVDGGPASGGWFLVDFDLRGLGGPLVNPCLYPDYGGGLSESERIDLPVNPDGAPLRALVRLKYGPRMMRLDPSASKVDIRIGTCRIRRLSRAEAFLRMLRAIGRVDRSAARRVLVDSLRDFGGGRLSRAGHRLYDAFLALDSARASRYEDWLERFAAPLEPEEAARRMAALAERRVISVLMPVYNAPADVLASAIDSVMAQRYPHWQLCIADDASTARHVAPLLERAARDPRVRVLRRPSNGHISASSNDALSLATGSHVALLDHDDLMHPDALLHVAEALDAHPDAALVYTDEDKIDADGARRDPYFKPAFDGELLLGQNFPCHLSVYPAALVREVGGFRAGYEGAQDWDLALRVIERAAGRPVVHVPHVLYHWRTLQGSTALGVDAKGYAAEAGLRAVRDAIARRGLDADATLLPSGHVRVARRRPARAPRVSIVVPTRDRVELLRMCVESVLAKTTYPDFELIVVDNGSVEAETLDYLARAASDPRVRVIPYPHPFNYSAINNAAVAASSGEIVCLLNNDIEVIAPGWLDAMVAHAVDARVGAVGAMLYYPDDTIQHAGVLVGAGGVGGHAWGGAPRGTPGYMGRLHLAHSPLAVTAACLVVRRAAWDAVGGLDEGLVVAFNDVDFCLRLARAGFENRWVPEAELYHHESATRGLEDTPERQARFKSEVDFMLRRWGSALDRDPAYSPNLSLSGAPFSLAFPPRARAPRLSGFR